MKKEKKDYDLMTNPNLNLKSISKKGNKNLATKNFTKHNQTLNNFNVLNFTNFNYAPSANTTTTTSSNTQKHRKQSSTTMSKESFLYDCQVAITSSNTSISHTSEFKIDWTSVDFLLRKTGNKLEECPICKEDFFTIPMASQCGHLMCASCVFRYMDAKNKNAINCPVCNANTARRDLKFVVMQEEVEEEQHSVELVLMSKLKNSNYLCQDNMNKSVNLQDPQINFQKQQNANDEEFQYLYQFILKQMQYYEKQQKSCGELNMSEIVHRVQLFFTERYLKQNRELSNKGNINEFQIADYENQKDNFNITDPTHFVISYNYEHIRTVRDIEINQNEQTYFYQDLQGRKRQLHPIWFCIIRESYFSEDNKESTPKYLPSFLYSQELSMEDHEQSQNTYNRQRYLNHLEWGDKIKFVDIDHSYLEEILIDQNIQDQQQWKLPSSQNYIMESTQSKPDSHTIDNDTNNFDEKEEYDEQWEMQKRECMKGEYNIGYENYRIDGALDLGVIPDRHEDLIINTNSLSDDLAEENLNVASKEWGKITSMTEVHLMKKFGDGLTLEKLHQNDQSQQIINDNLTNICGNNDNSNTILNNQVLETKKKDKKSKKNKNVQDLSEFLNFR